jgi:hypothetical protein
MHWRVAWCLNWLHCDKFIQISWMSFKPLFGRKLLLSITRHKIKSFLIIYSSKNRRSKFIPSYTLICAFFIFQTCVFTINTPDLRQGGTYHDCTHAASVHLLSCEYPIWLAEWKQLADTLFNGLFLWSVKIKMKIRGVTQTIQAFSWIIKLIVWEKNCFHC